MKNIFNRKIVTKEKDSPGGVFEDMKESRTAA